MLLREEDGVGERDWVTSVVEMTECPKAGHDYRERGERMEKGRDTSPQGE